jgi:glucans biosynthesis protein
MKEVEGEHRATRCGAKTRSGTPCQSPPVRGKTRCRMHGGAPGSGAPFGRRNGNYRHGHFTAEAKGQHRRLRSLIQDARKMVKSLV